MQDDDIPTKPESPDPVMAVIGRIEGKVDILTNMVATFFEELSAQKLVLRDLEERVGFLERPANGR